MGKSLLTVAVLALVMRPCASIVIARMFVPLPYEDLHLQLYRLVLLLLCHLLSVSIPVPPATVNVSVNKSSESVPVSPAIGSVLLDAAVETAVILPFASTVIAGT